MIRALTAADWPMVRAIYVEGIETGNATFEATAPDWETWDHGHLAACRIVAERAGSIVGFAALSPVSRREVYRGVAEVSVYVAAVARGQGVGRILMDSLIRESETACIWTCRPVLPENHATIRLHVSAGFREVGRRERIGSHHGRWRDTVLLERRSERTGMD